MYQLVYKGGARCGSAPGQARAEPLGLILLCGRDGIHKKKGRLLCHKRPKSREETPKEGSDSASEGTRGSLPHALSKTIAISGSIARR